MIMGMIAKMIWGLVFFLCSGIFAIALDTLVFVLWSISALPNEQFFVGGFGVNVCFL